MPFWARGHSENTCTACCTQTGVSRRTRRPRFRDLLHKRSSGQSPPVSGQTAELFVSWQEVVLRPCRGDTVASLWCLSGGTVWAQLLCSALVFGPHPGPVAGGEREKPWGLAPASWPHDGIGGPKWAWAPCANSHRLTRSLEASGTKVLRLIHAGALPPAEGH